MRGGFRRCHARRKRPGTCAAYNAQMELWIIAIVSGVVAVLLFGMRLLERRTPHVPDTDRVLDDLRDLPEEFWPRGGGSPEDDPLDASVMRDDIEGLRHGEKELRYRVERLEASSILLLEAQRQAPSERGYERVVRLARDIVATLAGLTAIAVAIAAAI